jgi:crotonobetaine/carnitine-CoA ligase
MADSPELILDRLMLAPHALRHWAEEYPGRIALQHVDGPSITYGELDQQARTWANAFERQGVGPGTHVATFLPNQFDSHRVLLALAWVRAVEVPVNAAYTGRMLEYALAHADVQVLVTGGDLANRVVPLTARLPRLETVIVLDRPAVAGAWDGVRVVNREALLEKAEATTDLQGPNCWDIASLLYTSGTTGPSKAVRIPWGAIYQNWSWVPDDTFGPGEGLHCALPLFHNSGRSGFNCVLARGGRFVMREKFSATHVWDDVRQTNCVALALVGPLTALLYSAPPREDDAVNPVRHVVLGPMIPEMKRFEERFGVKVCVAYGQTEIGCPLASGWDHGPPSSCGRVRDTYPWPEVRIVDENDNPLGPGQPGEMIVRAKAPWGLNLGYYKMPEESVAAWRNGWFHTGDVLTYDHDGCYYFLDRLKDTIRRRGENISSFEVEQFVLGHPAVRECAAVGVRSPLGDEEILVAVITEDAVAFEPVELMEHLAPTMPVFMLPRYIDVLADLPRSETTGRVRKQDLRDRGLTATAWDRLG